MRAAVISFHTCPLDAPGEKNAGGMNVYVRRLAQELGALGCKTDIFTREHGPEHQPIEEISEGARVIHIPAGPITTPKEGLYDFVPGFTLGVLQFAERNGLRYDIIHAHYWLSGVAALELRAAWNAPVIATFPTLSEIKQPARLGESEPDIRVEQERRIIAEADALLVSTSYEQIALERLYEVQPVKVLVLPPGVDTELFRPVERIAAHDALGLNGRRVLLFVGRLDPLKGLEIVLEAMALLEDRDDVELVVVGGEQEGKSETARLRRVADVLGLGDHVRFVGMVPHEDLPNYYSAAEALVMPSYYESFGLAALEAMACGTPVVAARVGGLPAVVRDGETGFLVPWHCPEPFSQRIEMLLTNKGLRDSMGRAARERAAMRDWNTVAQETLALYAEAANTRRSRSA